MPLPDDATRLNHILDSSRKAVSSVSGKARRDVDRDEMLSLALVRLLEIIGKASTGISEELKDKYHYIPWRQMSGTRNRLIHGYFDIDYELVWITVTEELPQLIEQI